MGRSPGGGHGNPLQYCCPENPKDRGAWWATDQSVTESDTTEATSYAHAQVMWTTVQQLEEASKNRVFLGLYEWKAMIKGGMSEVMPVRLAGARSHS